MAHVTYEGIRLTELAEKAGITKQAMSELVVDLEQLGYLAHRRPARSSGEADRLHRQGACRRSRGDGDSRRWSPRSASGRHRSGRACAPSSPPRSPVLGTDRWHQRRIVVLDTQDRLPSRRSRASGAPCADTAAPCGRVWALRCPVAIRWRTKTLAGALAMTEVCARSAATCRITRLKRSRRVSPNAGLSVRGVARCSRRSVTTADLVGRTLDFPTRKP